MSLISRKNNIGCALTTTQTDIGYLLSGVPAYAFPHMMTALVNFYFKVRIWGVNCSKFCFIKSKILSTRNQMDHHLYAIIHTKVIHNFAIHFEIYSIYNFELHI